MTRARAALVALALLAAGFSTADATEGARRTPVVAAVERVGPAVVNIYTETVVDDAFGVLYGLLDLHPEVLVAERQKFLRQSVADARARRQLQGGGDAEAAAEPPYTQRRAQVLH